MGGRENLVNDEVLSFVKQQAMSVLANRLAQEQQQQQHQLLQQEQQQDRLHPSTDAEVEPLIPGIQCGSQRLLFIADPHHTMFKATALTWLSH